jgi:hypothetical protein
LGFCPIELAVKGIAQNAMQAPETIYKPEHYEQNFQAHE